MVVAVMEAVDMAAADTVMEVVAAVMGQQSI